MTHFRFMLKPWFWVLLGALLTASSALISRYIIMDNNTAILLLRQDAAHVDEIITNHWDNIGRLERDGNTALLMVWLAQEDEGKLRELKAYIKSIVKQHGNAESQQLMLKSLAEYEGHKNNNLFNATLEFVRHSREESSEIINKKYLEKITLEEQAVHIEHTNANYANIAVFLQIIGLIMVLSKDLARRTWPA